LNQSGKQVCDIDGEHFIGKPCHEILFGDDQTCLKDDGGCLAQQALEQGELVRKTRSLALGKGDERVYEITAMPIRNEQGEVHEIVEVFHDLSDVVNYQKLKGIFDRVEQAKQEWESSMDCVEDLVILIDTDKRIRRCNKKLVETTQLSYPVLLGMDTETLFAQHGFEEVESETGVHGRNFHHRLTGRYFFMTCSSIASGRFTGEVMTLQDVTERRIAAQKVVEKNKEIAQAYAELKDTQAQLLQQEKMASVGQLAAGVAHEINNPVGFVTSNINTLHKYIGKIEGFLGKQSEYLTALDSDTLQEIKTERRKQKIDFLLEDIPEMIQESLDGLDRVKNIVQSLKNFSRVDQAEKQSININDCLDDTITVAWNELKYKCTLHKKYGDVPLIHCYPQQLSQVFINLLVNAAHAIEKQGDITITTRADDAYVYVLITDTGSGIPEDKLGRIFEPFFTTKDVGKGTGLGLSITYDIITQKHEGEIEVESVVGEGTTFTVMLPLEKE